MKDYQLRVIDESNDLAAKRLRLETFINSDGFLKASDIEQRLLARQKTQMKAYHETLRERIQHFSSEDSPLETPLLKE